MRNYFIDYHLYKIVNTSYITYFTIVVFINVHFSSLKLKI
nr:MAG TPA: hypothetical protein [Caudoviricetes sp.]